VTALPRRITSTSGGVTSRNASTNAQKRCRSLANASRTTRSSGASIGPAVMRPGLCNPGAASDRCRHAGARRATDRLRKPLTAARRRRINPLTWLVETMSRDANDLLHGTLDVLVLKTLSWGPMHGYAIAQWIEQRTRGDLEIVDAALYKALHRLAESGAIDAE